MESSTSLMGPLRTSRLLCGPTSVPLCFAHGSIYHCVRLITGFAVRNIFFLSFSRYVCIFPIYPRRLLLFRWFALAVTYILLFQIGEHYSQALYRSYEFTSYNPTPHIPIKTCGPEYDLRVRHLVAFAVLFFLIVPDPLHHTTATQLYTIDTEYTPHTHRDVVVPITILSV